MKTPHQKRSYGISAMTGLFLLACSACHRDKEVRSESAAIEESALKGPVATEIPQLRKDFHILDSLAREYRRLDSEPQTQDILKKSRLLLPEIARLVEQLESTHPEMNEEERRIFVIGRLQAAKVKASSE